MSFDGCYVSAPACCPKCKGAIIDLRDCGFNPDAVARNGVCFIWGSHNDYTCVRWYEPRWPVEARLPKSPLPSL